MFNAEFVTLVTLKVPSGHETPIGLAPPHLELTLCTTPTSPAHTDAHRPYLTLLARSTTLKKRERERERRSKP